MKTLKILDIDLDFFLNKKHTGTVTETERLGSDFIPWEENKVRAFLEESCHLNKNSPITGKFFIHHDEVFYFLRELQQGQNYQLKFQIDHVDAHADLGTGDASYKYISTDILAKPLEERCFPKKKNGWEGISAGNFLAFAIACRWIEELHYITKLEWVSDLQWFLFRNFDPSSNSIELKQFTEAQMHQIIYGHGMREEAARAEPVSVEPSIPFSVIDFNTFRSDGKYDYVFLTQSPGFTPQTSDKLIPIIQEYMKID